MTFVPTLLLSSAIVPLTQILLMGHHFHQFLGSSSLENSTPDAMQVSIFSIFLKNLAFYTELVYIEVLLCETTTEVVFFFSHGNSPSLLLESESSLCVRELYIPIPIWFSLIGLSLANRNSPQRGWGMMFSYSSPRPATHYTVC